MMKQSNKITGLESSAVFYPCFTDLTELADYVYRAAWYLFPLRNELDRLEFWFSEEVEVNELLRPGSEMAPGLPAIANAFSEIEIKSVTKSSLEESLMSADFVFLHKEPMKKQLQQLIKGNRQCEVIRVDKARVQFSDSFFLRMPEKLPRVLRCFRDEAGARIKRLLPSLHSEKCYLFGTGPNLLDSKHFDFSDGLSIACNSMVVNDELLRHIQPDLLVIADPIFHAGPSAYAEKFRTALISQMRIHGCPLVVPMRDFHIYSTYLPADLRDRIVPLELSPGTEPVLDIISSGRVTTTSNILTLLQLPLAATLSDEIYIAGCDGRPLRRDGYFWTHNKSVQINEEMQSIKEAHPAFFNISYSDYYEQHIETLQRWISACENVGKHIYCLTPSYIPPLYERQLPLVLRSLKRSRAAVKVSIIVPSYNSKRYLEEAIASLLDENRNDLEVLIIDDFSDDGSHDLAKEIAEKDGRVTVFQNYFRKGVSGARNTGLAVANGQYIGFLDADDTICSGSLNARVAYLEEHTDVHIVHSRVTLIDENSDPLGVSISLGRNISFADMHGSSAHFNTIMFRASEIGDHISFEETMSNGEDWLALARLLRLGYVSYYVPNGTANYRVHSGSTVLKDFGRHEKMVLQVIDFVYGRADRAISSESWVEGLSWPPKVDVVNKRRLTGLIVSALEGNVSLTHEFLGDEEFRSWLQVRDVDYDSLLKVPAVRVTGRSIDKQHLISMSERVRIKNGLRALSRYQECQPLRAAIMALYHFRTKAVEGFDMGGILPQSGLFEDEVSSKGGDNTIHPDADKEYLVGPYARGEAHIDETKCVGELFSGPLNGCVMIDVGAHFGSSFLPFLNQRWTIFAFEPDSNNRKRLLERLQDNPNRRFVFLDKRCLSNERISSAAFFSSEESTGISALSAFHDSHEESQRVDVTTLVDFFEERPMPEIDFLKVDTEGHDLFVLQGYPWSRGRPAVVECEFEDNKTIPLGYTMHDLANFLIEMNYTVYVSEWHPVIRYGIHHDWKGLTPYSPETSYSRSWGNFVAFRDGIDEETLRFAIVRHARLESKVTPVTCDHAKRQSGKAASVSNGASAWSLSVANQEFRRGNFRDAMRAYIALYDAHGLRLYHDNALLAARRMGLGRVRTIEELRRRLSGH